jgi:hypothetical protein
VITIKTIFAIQMVMLAIENTNKMIHLS